jgi:hypothetical protein
VAHRHYVLGAVLATQGSSLWNFSLTERCVFPAPAPEGRCAVVVVLVASNSILLCPAAGAAAVGSRDQLPSL